MSRNPPPPPVHPGPPSSKCECFVPQNKQLTSRLNKVKHGRWRFFPFFSGRCVLLLSEPISHRVFCSLEHIPRILLGFVPLNLQRRRASFRRTQHKNTPRWPLLFWILCIYCELGLFGEGIFGLIMLTVDILFGLITFSLLGGCVSVVERVHSSMLICT